MFKLVLCESVHSAPLMKFILLEDGTCLVGRANFHKELRPERFGSRIIGAGILPLFPEREPGVLWSWESVGYGVVTPRELRSNLVEFLLQNSEKNWWEDE